MNNLFDFIVLVNDFADSALQWYCLLNGSNDFLVDKLSWVNCWVDYTNLVNNFSSFIKDKELSVFESVVSLPWSGSCLVANESDVKEVVIEPVVLDKLINSTYKLFGEVLVSIHDRYYNTYNNMFNGVLPKKKFTANAHYFCKAMFSLSYKSYYFNKKFGSKI